MALDIYYKEDIQNAIEGAVVLAVHMHTAGGDMDERFVRGIMAHAHAHAHLFGLKWKEIVAECTEELGIDVGALLDVPIVRVIEG